MKRIFPYVLTAFLLISSCFTSPTKKAFATSISDNSVIILSGKVNEQNKVVIEANLKVNTGISGMTLELSYNKTAMVLTNVVLGSALSSLNPVTTNTSTSQGYAIYPFVFNYSGQENDFTTGKLFILTFDLYQTVENGNYVVSLKYKKNRDVNYYDDKNDVKTKNLYIDNAEIQIRDNSVAQISSISGDEQTTNWIIIIGIILSSTAVVAIGTLVALKLIKKRRNWKRL